MRSHGLGILNFHLKKYEIGVCGAAKILPKHGDVVPKYGLFIDIFDNFGLAGKPAIPHFPVHKADLNLGVFFDLGNRPGTA